MPQLGVASAAPDLTMRAPEIWTGLDGDPLRRGTPQAGFPIWEPTVGGCRLVMLKLLMVGVGPLQ